MLLMLLTILLISFLFAPLGCVMLWQRYNHFSDGLAHACLFSGILSYYLNFPQLISVVVVGLVFASLVFILKFYSNKNTVINLVSSAMIAAAIIFASKIPETSILEKMLFGDILSTSWNDLVTLFVILVIVVLLLSRFLNQLVVLSLSSDLASVNKVPVNILELSVLLILSLVASVSIKIVGALLITALLVIPPAGARLISDTPLKMILYSIIISLVSGIAGFVISFSFDWPLSPTIAIMSVIIYGITALIHSMHKRGSI